MVGGISHLRRAVVVLKGRRIAATIIKTRAKSTKKYLQEDE